MEFGILGPLEIREADRVRPLTGSKQRALLALLLIHANEVVSTERLLDELWSTEPPGSGSTALQVRVSQLRKTLGAGGPARCHAGARLRPSHRPRAARPVPVRAACRRG